MDDNNSDGYYYDKKMISKLSLPFLVFITDDGDDIHVIIDRDTIYDNIWPLFSLFSISNSDFPDGRTDSGL